MGNAAFAYDNLAKRCVITASSSLGEFTPDLVVSDHTTDGWRCNDATAWIEFYNPGQLTSVYYIAIINHNIFSNYASPTLEVRMGSSPGSNSAYYRAPASFPFAIIGQDIYGNYRYQTIIPIPTTPYAPYLRLVFDNWATVDGYISIGAISFGTMSQLSRNYSYDYQVGIRDETEVVSSLGKQDYATRVNQYRMASVTFENLTASDATSLNYMDIAAGNSGNVLYMPDPDSSEVSAEAIYGRLVAAEPATLTSHGRYRRSYQIKERL